MRRAPPPSRAAAAAVAAALTALLGMSAATLAAPAPHVVFVGSEPPANARLAAPPARVAARFEKEIDPKSTLRLLRSDGSVVDAGAARIEQGATLVITAPALAAGVYAAHWKAIDPHDGHTLDGYFAFAVGEDAPAQLQGLAVTATAQSIDARLEITPGRLGENSYRLTLSGPSGPARAERAALRFAPQVTPAIGHADAQLAAAEAAFTGRGMELALRGPWKVTALVRLPGGSQDTPFEFTLTAPAAPLTPTPTLSPSPAPTPTASPSPTATAAATPAAAPAAGGPDALVLLAILGAVAVGGGLVWRMARRRSG